MTPSNSLPQKAGQALEGEDADAQGRCSDFRLACLLLQGNSQAFGWGNFNRQSLQK